MSARIVALTANPLAGDREACIASGMDDYLAKPISSVKLADALARHLNGVRPQAPFPVPSASARAPVAAVSAVRPRASVVFDPSVLAAMPMVADGSQPDFEREVLELFASTARDLPGAMGDALAHGRRDDVLRHLHTLNSSGAQVGATELSDQARTLESALRAGKSAEAHWHEQLCDACDRFDLAWRQAQGPSELRAPERA